MKGAARRLRYYAYDARQGGVLWMEAKIHGFIQSKPHTVLHFQCIKFTGETQLMSREEFKAAQEQWRKARSI